MGILFELRFDLLLHYFVFIENSYYIMLLRRLVSNARVHISRRTKVLVTRPDYPRLNPGRFHNHPPNKPLSPKELISAIAIMSVFMWGPAFLALEFNKKVRPNN